MVIADRKAKLKETEARVESLKSEIQQIKADGESYQGELSNRVGKLEKLRRKASELRSSILFFKSVVVEAAQSRDEPCSVCLEPLDEMIVTSCGHSQFCRACIIAVVNAQKRCPLCRAALDASQIYSVADPKQIVCTVSSSFFFFLPAGYCRARHREEKAR